MKRRADNKGKLLSIRKETQYKLMDQISIPIDQPRNCHSRNSTPSYQWYQTKALSNICLTTRTIQEVEKILDSRRRGNELSGKDNPLKKNQREVVKGASRLRREFHRSHLDAPGIPTIWKPRKLYMWSWGRDLRRGVTLQ